MPIDKVTGKKVCINGCGILQKASIDDQPNFVAHFVPAAFQAPEQSYVAIPMNTGFVLDIWFCQKCRYIELYDFVREE